MNSKLKRRGSKCEREREMRTEREREKEGGERERG